MRAQIDEVDEAIREQTADNIRNDDTSESTGTRPEELISSSLGPPMNSGPSSQGRTTTFDAGAVILRSHQPPVTLGSLEYLGAEKPHFRNFRAKLTTWLTNMLPLYGFNFMPGFSRVQLQADDQVSHGSMSGLAFKLITF